MTDLNSRIIDTTIRAGLNTPATRITFRPDNTGMGAKKKVDKLLNAKAIKISAQLNA